MDNTAKDAAKAKAAGLSYGYWKLANPNTKPVDDTEPKPNKQCKECGKMFYARRADKLYCCVECRERWNDRAYSRRHRTGIGDQHAMSEL